jgi:hypothetical protein
MKLLFAALLITAVFSFAEELVPHYPMVFFGPRTHHSPFNSEPSSSPSVWNAPKPVSVVAWQGNTLEPKAIYPETPFTLEWDGEVTVAIHYNNSSQDKVRIFARPYFQGRPVMRCGSHPSPQYAPGSGDIEGWFTCCGPAVVDEIRIRMLDDITNEAIASTKLPVQFAWEVMPPNPTPRPHY